MLLMHQVAQRGGERGKDSNKSSPEHPCEKTGLEVAVLYFISNYKKLPRDQRAPRAYWRRMLSKAARWSSSKRCPVITTLPQIVVDAQGMHAVPELLSGALCCVQAGSPAGDSRRNPRGCQANDSDITHIFVKMVSSAAALNASDGGAEFCWAARPPSDAPGTVIALSCIPYATQHRSVLQAAAIVAAAAPPCGGRPAVTAATRCTVPSLRPAFTAAPPLQRQHWRQRRGGSGIVFSAPAEASTAASQAPAAAVPAEAAELSPEAQQQWAQCAALLHERCGLEGEAAHAALLKAFGWKGQGFWRQVGPTGGKGAVGSCPVLGWCSNSLWLRKHTMEPHRPPAAAACLSLAAPQAGRCHSRGQFLPKRRSGRTRVDGVDPLPPWPCFLPPSPPHAAPSPSRRRTPQAPLLFFPAAAGARQAGARPRPGGRGL